MAKRPKKWDRCLYCDASIAGDDAHVAALHDPYCPHGKSLLKLSSDSKRVTDLGYDNLDDMIAVLRRNAAWLEAIHEALNRYRVTLTKSEPEAFRDLTRAIQEPPT